MSLPLKEIKITRFTQVQAAPANVFVMPGDNTPETHEDANASAPASNMTQSGLEMSFDFEQVVEVLGDAIVGVDSSGAIRLWNASAERIFGFTADEVLGESLELIIPEHFRERYWPAYGKTMASGQMCNGSDLQRVPAVHKDGRILSIALTVGLLYGAQRKVTGIVAVVRDETARSAEERDLRKHLSELERNIAREYSPGVVGGEHRYWQI